MRMFRTPEWKLVRDFLNPHRDELYHLKEDPLETTNLLEGPRSSAIQATLGHLHLQLVEAMRRVGDRVSDDRGR